MEDSIRSINAAGDAQRGAKARVLADQLRAQIRQGRWQPGARLPTEQELIALHGVGLNTVRRAVRTLVAEGLVRRRRGSGTFVEESVAAAGLGPRPRFVGVLVPSTSYVYPRVISGVERVMTAAGVQVILASSEYDVELEVAQLRRLLDAGAEGLLLVPNLHLHPDPARRIAELRALPVPYVLMERRPTEPAPDDDTSYVCTDVVGGAYAAVRHLVEAGHRRIGHLGRVGTATSDAVAQGFERAIADFSLPRLPAAVVRRDEWSTDDLAGYAASCAAHEVTAVFCLGDREAAALLPHARAVGLTVPERLAVISYDDEVASLAEVPLTAISPPKEEVGQVAAELLLRRIAGTTTPRRVELQPRLVMRSSVRAPAEVATRPG